MLKPLPPYLSFRTFRKFLAKLKDQGIPNKIDRSSLPSKSGAAQSQLLSALRYFGLIDDYGVPTTSLSDLTHANESERPQLWGGILERAYSSLSELDLERATTEEIMEALWKEGIQSQETQRKALSFFCMAARDAGIQLSPHIRRYAGRRSAHPAESGTNENQKRIVPFPKPKIVARVRERSRFELALKRFPEFNPSWAEKERANWLEGFNRVLRMVEDAEGSSKLDGATWKAKH